MATARKTTDEWIDNFAYDLYLAPSRWSGLNWGRVNANPYRTNEFIEYYTKTHISVDPDADAELANLVFASCEWHLHSAKDREWVSDRLPECIASCKERMGMQRLLSAYKAIHEQVPATGIPFANWLNKHGCLEHAPSTAPSLTVDRDWETLLQANCYDSDGIWVDARDRYFVLELAQSVDESSEIGPQTYHTERCARLYALGPGNASVQDWGNMMRHPGRCLAVIDYYTKNDTSTDPFDDNEIADLMLSSCQDYLGLTGKAYVFEQSLRECVNDCATRWGLASALQIHKECARESDSEQESFSHWLNDHGFLENAPDTRPELPGWYLDKGQ